MKMLMVVYSGPSPRRVSSLLEAHRAGGYTQLENGHGAGNTGKREGTRAFPGESTLFVSVIDEARSAELLDALRGEAQQLPAGERLHAAVLPTESFF